MLLRGHCCVAMDLKFPCSKCGLMPPLGVRRKMQKRRGALERSPRQMPNPAILSLETSYHLKESPASIHTSSTAEPVTIMARNKNEKNSRSACQALSVQACHLHPPFLVFVLVQGQIHTSPSVAPDSSAPQPSAEKGGFLCSLLT